MQDEQILDLYFARDEKAIRASEQKYGGYCHKIAGNILPCAEDVEDTASIAARCGPRRRATSSRTFPLCALS